MQEDDEDADVVVKPKEKTQFTVKLTKFDETSKVKLIKQIKALTSGMNLVQVNVCVNMHLELQYSLSPIFLSSHSSSSVSIMHLTPAA